MAGGGRTGGTHVARHVELSAAGLAGSVKGDSLRTKEVVAVSNIGRDGELLLSAALVDDVVAPGVRSGVVSALEDLEPGRRAVRRGGVVYLGHVDSVMPKG